VLGDCWLTDRKGLHELRYVGISQRQSRQYCAPRWVCKRTKNQAKPVGRFVYHCLVILPYGDKKVKPKFGRAMVPEVLDNETTLAPCHDVLKTDSLSPGSNAFASFCRRRRPAKRRNAYAKPVGRRRRLGKSVRDDVKRTVYANETIMRSDCRRFQNTPRCGAASLAPDELLIRHCYTTLTGHSEFLRGIENNHPTPLFCAWHNRRRGSQLRL